MQGDPALKKYSHIILDEIHERDALCDFVLAILKDIVTKVFFFFWGGRRIIIIIAVILFQ